MEQVVGPDWGSEASLSDLPVLSDLSPEMAVRWDGHVDWQEQGESPQPDGKPEHVDSGEAEDSAPPPGCFAPPVGPPPGEWFPLGVWYHWIGGTGNEDHDRGYYESSFQDLAAHGIDLVVAVFVFGQNRVWLLEEAEKAGISVIMGMGEMTALVSQQMVTLPQLADPLAADLATPVKDLSSLHGYYIADEPGIHNIMPLNLLVAKDAFKKADPTRQSFVTFALINKMAEYVAVMQPETLVTDMYPLYKFITWPETFSGGLHIASFLIHLETAHSLAAGRPMWLVAQAFENKLQWRMPEFEELTAMVYLAVNRGVRGVVYFLYQSLPVDEELEGLVNILGQPTDNYIKLAAFHEQFEPIRNAVAWSQPTPAFATAESPFDLGFFQHALGFRYVLVVNRDVMSAQTAMVQFASSSLPGMAAVFDEVSGEEVPLQESGGETAIEVEVGPGGGRMFRVCAGQ